MKHNWSHPSIRACKSTLLYKTQHNIYDKGNNTICVCFSNFNLNFVKKFASFIAQKWRYLNTEQVFNLNSFSNAIKRSRFTQDYRSGASIILFVRVPSTVVLILLFLLCLQNHPHLACTCWIQPSNTGPVTRTYIIHPMIIC